MQTIEKIRELVSLSAQSLEKAVMHYWPVVNPEFNGLQEANLTVHFAAHAMQQGLHVYPEASNGNSTHGHSRLDLLVRGKIGGKNVAIMVESKKLFSAGKAAEMNADFHKMQGFEFVLPLYKAVGSKGAFSTYAVLLAITTYPGNEKWWREPYEYDGKSWDALGQTLAKASDRGSFSVSATYPQYVLYAIYRV